VVLVALLHKEIPAARRATVLRAARPAAAVLGIQAVAVVLVALVRMERAAPSQPQAALDALPQSLGRQ
jgi:hypothetical protein